MEETTVPSLHSTEEVKNVTLPTTKLQELTDSAMFKDQGIKLKWISLRINMLAMMFIDSGLIDFKCVHS